MNDTHTRRVALVTGANRGLGFETARQLGRLGMTVLVGARDPRQGTRAVDVLCADGLDSEAVQLDVTSRGDALTAAEEVRHRHGRLDVLVNNAGILPEATTDTSGPIAIDLFEQTFATNLFGAVIVTEAFLPLLLESDAGRIVNVSSTMGSLADQSDPGSPYHQLGVPAYRASKTALNTVTVALSKALRSTPVKVNSVCPGWVQTDLAPGNRQHAPTPAAEAASIVVRMATVGADGPTGRFVDRDGVVPW